MLRRLLLRKIPLGSYAVESQQNVSATLVGVVSQTPWRAELVNAPIQPKKTQWSTFPVRPSHFPTIRSEHSSSKYASSTNLSELAESLKPLATGSLSSYSAQMPFSAVIATSRPKSREVPQLFHKRKASELRRFFHKGGQARRWTTRVNQSVIKNPAKIYKRLSSQQSLVCNCDSSPLICLNAFPVSFNLFFKLSDIHSWSFDQFPTIFKRSPDHSIRVRNDLRLNHKLYWQLSTWPCPWKATNHMFAKPSNLKNTFLMDGFKTRLNTSCF